MLEELSMAPPSIAGNLLLPKQIFSPILNSRPDEEVEA